jgi:hypothetical protein
LLIAHFGRTNYCKITPLYPVLKQLLEPFSKTEVNTGCTCFQSLGRRTDAIRALPPEFDYSRLRLPPDSQHQEVTLKHVTEVHYHIRWFRRSELDWESFSTREEAETGARRLMRPNERYTIEEQSDEGCARCPSTPAAKFEKPY